MFEVVSFTDGYKIMNLTWYKFWFLWKEKIVHHGSHFETNYLTTKQNANFVLHVHMFIFIKTKQIYVVL